MYSAYYIILIISTLLFSVAAVGVAHFLFSRLELFDNPTERSNHTTAVPTGAGIAFVLMGLGFMMVAGASGDLLFAATLLAVVSFIDDVRSLPVGRRLGVQLMAVIIALPDLHGPVFQGLFPMWLDRVLVVLVWMWFVNLYNFMDGIDGITINETAAIGIGLAVLSLFNASVPNNIAIDSLIMVAAVIGFYPWNRHPAKLFMGDSGSVPLGFVMGFLLFSLAAHGQWAAALILPAYYMTDATSTLAKRLAAGKKIWQAHSDHAYQRAVRSGRPHDQVVHSILLLNILLILLAIVSSYGNREAWVALAAAYAASFFLTVRFRTFPPVTRRETAYSA